MSLARQLPDRPLRLTETHDGVGIGSIEIVSPLKVSLVRLTGHDDEVVIGSVLLAGDRAEIAGYDPDLHTWKCVSVFPDIGDRRGVDAALDMLDSWLFDRYGPRDIAPITVDL